MTRETPHWLGDLEPAEAEPGQELPLWPAQSLEQVTVSYVHPAEEAPTESWTADDREPAHRRHDDWDDRGRDDRGRDDRGRDDRGRDDRGWDDRGWDDRGRERDDSGLGALGLVTITGRRPMRPPAAPSRPVRRPRETSSSGLVALVLVALLSAFLAWVTAEPVWLALGHSTPGTVTVTKCAGHDLNRRCVGTFRAADPRFTRVGIPLMGDVPEAGTAVPARMTSDRGQRAYVEVDAGGRAAFGVALIVLCGLAIVRATGVRRLPTRRARTATTLISLAGPLALLIAMLALTF
jgi:hypothetical protein